MKLHHLRVTAFGPFAGTVEVDLDELGAAATPQEHAVVVEALEAVRVATSGEGSS